jgi:fumarate reductase flavoprotein subunit
LRREFWPDAAQFGDNWHFYIGIDTVRGDAIPLGKQVGAEIAGHNCGLMINSSSYFKSVEGLFPGWPVYVNQSGRRFISEQADYSIMAQNINRQPGKTMYVIMDDAAFSRDAKDPRYLNTAAIGDTAAAASLDPEWLAIGLQKGDVHKADTIAELAQKVGINREALVATILEYNADVAKGYDSHFLKDPSTMVPIDRPPFYAAPRRASQISVSAVGLHINADAKVYSTAGSYVAGLYAAGEASAGVWTHYVGSGTSIGSCMIFGRIAGRGAAEHSLAVRAK